MSILYWFGALHAAIYLLAGVLLAITLVTMKIHMLCKVMGRIITWHIARARWTERGALPHEEPRP